jgi:hypothetical protein
MKRIEEPKLDQHGWALGVLQYIKLLRYPDAAERVPAEALPNLAEDLLSKVFAYQPPFVRPNLETEGLGFAFEIFMWARVKVDGDEYICAFAVGLPAPVGEGEIFVRFAGGDYNNPRQFRPQKGLQLRYEQHRQVFLPIRTPHGARVIASVTGV